TRAAPEPLLRGPRPVTRAGPSCVHDPGCPLPRPRTSLPVAPNIPAPGTRRWPSTDRIPDVERSGARSFHSRGLRDSFVPHQSGIVPRGAGRFHARQERSTWRRGRSAWGRERSAWGGNVPPRGGGRCLVGGGRGGSADELGLVGEDHGLDAVAHTELGEDAAHVRLDGRLGE